MTNQPIPVIDRLTSAFNRQPATVPETDSTVQARRSNRGFAPGLMRLGTMMAVVAGLLFAIQPMRGASILWVSDAPPVLGFSGAQPELTDGGFIKLLQAAGHTVERFDNPETTAELLTAEDVAKVNTNDLIIIGRATASGQFQDGQGDQWNTEITKPLICMSPYLVRTSGRMGWFSGGNLPDNAAPTVATAVDQTNAAVDFVLSGVEMIGNSTVDPYDELLDRNTSHITDPVVPGGRVLLTATFFTEGNETVEATGNMIADFPAGTSVRTDLNVLAGYRMFFAGGSREGASAPNGIPQYTGRETLTPTGESIFLKAVELALRSGVPPTNNPAQPIAITRQPVSTTLGEGGSVRFSVAVTGATPRTLQWQRDTGDGVTFTNIPGAQTTFSASAYTIASALRGDNGARFRLVATNANNSVTSDVVTLTVVADNTAPVPVSAASVTGATVDINFDEVIDNASGAFANVANYRVNAGQPTVTAATPRADGKSVVLSLSGNPGGGPSVGATFTVNVSNLSDLRGNAISATGVTVNGTSLEMSMTPIGVPNPDGTSFALGPGTLEVTGGGLHFPILNGASDQFQFAHKQVTGDFDARVKVDSMVGDGRFESVAQAILTARETTDDFSAGVSVTVTPPAPGNDTIQAMVRLVANDVTNNVGDPFIPNGLPNNAWMRITRAGDLFTAYRSTNGTQWVELGNVTVTLLPALQVGVGAVSHRNTRTMTATFSNVQIGAPGAAEIRLVNLSRSGGAFSASFQSQNNLTYTPQYKDSLTTPAWTSLPGITGDGTIKTFTDSGVPPTGSRFYRISQP